jgi:hypothetical protein
MEEGLWLSTLYMAFYNIGSAYAAFQASPPWRELPAWTGVLPVGVQRRNLRGGKVLHHLDDFIRLTRLYGSAYAFLTKGFIGDPKKDWTQLKANVSEPWGNGRWSIYTTAELYQKANKLPVWPCDIMNDDSTGPAAGLSKLFGVAAVDQTPDILDPLADRLFRYMRGKMKTRIPYLPKGHYDYAMMESQLCDFNSLTKGRYYIGRDIDRDQERIKQAEELLQLQNIRMSLSEVWEARGRVFAPRYLGEVQKWDGRQDYALQHYKVTKEIADHKTIRIRKGFWL